MDEGREGWKEGDSLVQIYCLDVSHSRSSSAKRLNGHDEKAPNRDNIRLPPPPLPSPSSPIPHCLRWSCLRGSGSGRRFACSRSRNSSSGGGGGGGNHRLLRLAVRDVRTLARSLALCESLGFYSQEYRVCFCDACSLYSHLDATISPRTGKEQLPNVTEQND